MFIDLLRKTAKLNERNWFMLNNLVGILRSKSPLGEEGQDLAEYSLLIGLIALVVIISVSLIGTNISGLFSFLANSF